MRVPPRRARPLPVGRKWGRSGVNGTFLITGNQECPVYPFLVCPVPLGEEQELPHPAHEVGLVLRKRQILVPKELGIPIQHRLKVFTAHGHK